jgi:hypothetical protein
MSNEEQQTAVEWLEDRYRPKNYITAEEFQQAKEMDKQQKMNAYNQGYRDGEVDASNPTNMSKDISEFSNAENYVNQTYGGNK